MVVPNVGGSSPRGPVPVYAAPPNVVPAPVPILSESELKQVILNSFSFFILI